VSDLAPVPTPTAQLSCLLLLAVVLPARGEVTEERAAPAEAPVLFRHEEIFRVRSQVGRLGPGERARAIQERLAELPPSAASEIRVEERSGSSDIHAGAAFVMSVTGLDAAPTGRTRQQLAADYARNLRVALEREGKGRSVRGVLVAILLTVVATALLGVVLRLCRSGFPVLYTRLRAWQGIRVRTLRVHGIEVLTAERATQALVAAARGLRVAVVVLAIAVYANAVLGFFPWTRGIARAVFVYVWGALTAVLAGIAGFLPNLVFIAIIVAVTRLVLKVARLLAAQVQAGNVVVPGFFREWADPTYKIVRFLVVAFALVVMVPYLPGSDTAAFKGVSIFLGVLLALGATSAVSNVVAGVVLTYMRPFSVGDRVKIAETVGDVVERNLLMVRVRTIKNVEVTLSNAMVLGAHVENYSAAGRSGGLVLHTTVTIGYDAPWRKVHELLVSAAESVEGILAVPRPFVLQTSLDDFSASYQLNAYTDRVRDMAILSSKLHEAIQDRFHEAGIEIMSPHFASIRDGNAVAIPAESLPDAYEPPSFRLERVERSPATPRRVRGSGGEGS
jgi:small-conductance mechanosensitive channel